MKKWCWIAVALALVVAAPLLYAQNGGGAPGGMGGGMGGGGMASQRPAAAMPADLGLNEQEQAAVQANAEAKMKARQTLRESLTKLRQVAYDDQATAEQISKAIDGYAKDLKIYQEAARDADKALVRKLSPKSRARCLVAGVLDNGMNMGGRGGGGNRPGVGAGGPGGGGGGMGRGGGGSGPRGGGMGGDRPAPPPA
jgi:hypothetical protein